MSKLPSRPDAESPIGGPSRTWWARLTRQQERREDVQDARIDGAWREALQAAKGSADSAWRIARFQWLVIITLVLAVVALAGYSVGFTVPGVGEAKIGSAGDP